MTNIPVIYIETEEDEEKYLIEYKYSIHTKILESIELSIKENIDSVELFQVVNNLRGFTFVVMVDRDNWLDSLEKCLKFYTDSEEYELCGRTKNLIEEVKNGK